MPKKHTEKQYAETFLTNETEVVLNRENIKKDFDIFYAEKINNKSPEEWLKWMNALDGKMVMSVTSANKTDCYLLFDKKDNVSFSKLKDALETVDEDIIVRKEKFDDVPDYKLAQLMINTLAQGYSLEYRFNNIDRLYTCKTYPLKDNNSDSPILSFVAEFWSDMTLNIKINTYTKYSKLSDYEKKKNYTMYVYNKEKYKLMRAMEPKKCPDEEKYVQKSNGKNSMDFLNFEEISKFEKSKSGAYIEIKDSVEERLSDYMTLDYKVYQTKNVYAEGKSESRIAVLTEKFRNKKILIKSVISSEDEKAYNEKAKRKIDVVGLKAALKDEICKFLSYDGSRNEIFTDDETDEQAYQIVICHSKEYYEKTKKEDPHNKINGMKAIQHIVIQDFDPGKPEKISPKVKAILTELVIKEEVVNRKLCLYMPVIPKPLFFVKIERNKDEQNVYTRMKLSPDGSLDIKRLSTDMKLDPEDRYSVESYEDKREEYLCVSGDNCVEGFIYYDLDYVTVLARTPLRTLPNIEKLRNELTKTDKKKRIDIKVLNTAAEEFIKKENIKEKDADKLLTSIKEAVAESNDSNVTLKALFDKGRLSGRMGVAMKFSDFFYDYTDGKILLCPGFKNAKNMDENFSGMLNIRTFTRNGRLLYYVGLEEHELKQSIPRACVVRELWCSDPEHIIDEEVFVKMLTADYIRQSSRNTVVPYAFKYINEYNRMLAQQADK